MHRMDLTPGRPLLAARIAVMSALPTDGTPIGYAQLALIAGEDCGAVVGDLVDHGMVTAMQVDGAMVYLRTAH